MNFKQAAENIAKYGGEFGFYCVPVPFVRPEFVNASDQLTVWNDACGGVLAVTHKGLWYPFWPENPGQRFPELPPPEQEPYIDLPGFKNWKDACIAQLNPEERIFARLPPLDDEPSARDPYACWRINIVECAARLRDPFVADVNETLLIGLKEREHRDETS